MNNKLILKIYEFIYYKIKLHESNLQFFQKKYVNDLAPAPPYGPKLS